MLCPFGSRWTDTSAGIERLERSVRPFVATVAKVRKRAFAAAASSEKGQSSRRGRPISGRMPPTVHR